MPNKDFINIKRAISENRVVMFRYFRDGQLWYVTQFEEKFPVPVSDIGTATFLNTDKAILFMRYMRKWNQKLVGVAQSGRALG